MYDLAKCGNIFLIVLNVKDTTDLKGKRWSAAMKSKLTFSY